MTASKNNFQRRLVAGLFPFVFLAFFARNSARAQDQGKEQGSGAIRVNVNLVDSGRHRKNQGRPKSWPI